MCDKVDIYEIHFKSRKFAILSLEDIEQFYNKCNKLLTDELIDTMRIIPMVVDKNNPKYMTAVHNTVCLHS